MNKGSLKRRLVLSFLVLSIIVAIVQGFAIFELLRAKKMFRN